MSVLKYFCTLLLISSSVLNCQRSDEKLEKFKFGADVLIEEHLDILNNKKIGLVTNHTSLLSNGTHLLDTLLSLGIDVSALFTPEHGLFGNFERGKIISHSKIENIPLYSLHGNVKKPTEIMLKNLDLIIYDLQDLGVRFYTYVSTLYYVLESAVAISLPIIILDRPNPNGGLTVNGPTLDADFKSFLGLCEIPVLYGLTPGELTVLYLNEFILNDIKNHDLTVVTMRAWKRGMTWNEMEIEWMPPSPNIPNWQTAIIYPGICFLEGTNISEGRGTEDPFLKIGAPFITSNDLLIEMNDFVDETFELQPVSFIPKSIIGKAANPKYENKICNGIQIKLNDEKNFNAIKFGLALIYTLNKLYPDQLLFEDQHFDLLAGTDQLRKLILENRTPDFIIESWQSDLDKFKSIRKKYLKY